MAGEDELLRLRREAYRAWQAHMTPETEKALTLADDALRRMRHGEWEADGVTNASLREVHEEDECDDG